MKRVLWVCDEPNWAYDVNAKALAKHMKRFEHEFFYCSIQEGEITTENYDIVVVMYPLHLSKCNKLDNVFSVLDSVRATVSAKADLLSKTFGIICCNKELLNFAKKLNNNAVLVSNGLDLDYFKPIDKRPDRKFTVGFAGDTREAAGIYKGWPIYQEAVNKLGSLVEQFNVGKGVNQIPVDRMVEDFYHKIDCLVLLSINEGCSNVIAEALACGLPVICTKVGYHGHTLDGRQNIFVERNVEQVIEAIKKISQDKEMCKSMGIEARNFASIHHSITGSAMEYTRLFLECCNKL